MHVDCSNVRQSDVFLDHPIMKLPSLHDLRLPNHPSLFYGPAKDRLSHSCRGLDQILAKALQTINGMPDIVLSDVEVLLAAELARD